ncbi:MAG: hypothetical protein MZU84_08925 [Sphingobacterium sp.]|nr:hypothetical protein [Sphingobacterium sp.]
MIALDCRGHGQSDKPHDPAAVRPRNGGRRGAPARPPQDREGPPDRLLERGVHRRLGGCESPRARPQRRLRRAGAPGRGGEMRSGSSEVEVFAKAVDEGEDLGSYIIAVTPPGRPKPTEDQAKAMAKYLIWRKGCQSVRPGRPQLR